MRHYITDAKDYEIEIQKLQNKLYNALSDKWAVGETNFEFYGLTRKIQVDGKIAPGWWDVRTDKDYKAVTFDDRKKAVAFFGMDDNINHSTSISTANVHLVFFVDLHGIYENTQRRDSKARKAVFDLLFFQRDFGFTITKETFGQEALSEYPALDSPKYDIHPLHVFRFDLELKYKPFPFKPIK